MKHLTVKEKEIASFEKMKTAFHYKNINAAPKMVKVVLSSATGSIKDNKKKDLINEILCNYFLQLWDVKTIEPCLIKIDNDLISDYLINGNSIDNKYINFNFDENTVELAFLLFKFC